MGKQGRRSPCLREGETRAHQGTNEALRGPRVFMTWASRAMSTAVVGDPLKMLNQVLRVKGLRLQFGCSITRQPHPAEHQGSMRSIKEHRCWAPHPHLHPPPGCLTGGSPGLGIRSFESSQPESLDFSCQFTHRPQDGALVMGNG